MIARILVAAFLAIGLVRQASAQFAPGINSGNVQEVFYSGDRFSMTGPGLWEEISPNGRFTFDDQGYDESHRYLFDSSRNLTLGLDVGARQIYIVLPSGQFQPLYQMTGAQMVSSSSGAGGGTISQQPATSVIVSYSCNEGIPLIVRYENSGNTSVAFASHDSFPEVRMEQAVSGSGSLYVAPGYELHTKGDTAIFIFSGTQDICVED